MDLSRPFPPNRLLAMLLLVALVPASLGYMYHEGNATTVTVLPVDGAPGRIVFIADPHLRDGNMAHIERTIGQINALHPSVVLIGGDFTYRGAEDLPLNQVWSGIDAPVYAILGNHDYLAGLGGPSIAKKMLLVQEADLNTATYDVSGLDNGDVDPVFAGRVVEELEKAGVTVLRNEAVTLDIGGEPVMIVGLDDCWAGLTRPPEIPGTDAFTLYLLHEPECRAAWDADLILAGHTHGGQFMPANLHALDEVGVVELSGMKMRNGVPTYITQGIGTSNFNPQLRFSTSPEIVVIDPASGS
ncbi:MAG: metallophosphoesterase [Methanomicrobiales archaeon]|nr:metallophosphoesterase [Methanomicrobiales archaeon]